MKKILFAAAAVFVFGFANAQEEKSDGGFAKGDVFVTGAFTFRSSNDKDFNSKTAGFEVAPQVGYFLTENIAIGARLGFTSNEQKTAGTTTFDQSSLSAGAFGRYYFTPADKFSLFAQLGVDYFTTENNLPGGTKFNGLDAGLGAGLNYFVSSNFSIEAGVAFLGFSSGKEDVPGAKGGTAFNFGADWRTITFGVNYKF